MSNTTVELLDYKGWKNCIKLSNGLVDIIALTEAGIRIMSFGLTDKPNELYEFPDDLGHAGGKEFHIYGGHRLWHAPEIPERTYQPDNDPVEYTLLDDGFILKQKTEKWTQIEKEVKVTLPKGSQTAEITHTMRNLSPWAVSFAPWAITQLAPGGMEIMPLNTRDTGFLPNGMVALWPYNQLNDHRVAWGGRYITLTQDPKYAPRFKLGLANEAGWAAYQNHGRLFVKQYEHVMDGVYPDYGFASFETYVIDLCIEMESLAPMRELAPGQAYEHKETWSVYECADELKTEEDFDRVILPLLDKI